MRSKKQAAKGISTFELLIIFIVVGVLTALIAVTWSGVMQRNRDNQRKKDLDAVAAQIETYQALTGQYPTLSDLNNSAFRKNYFSKIDPDNLKDPKGSSSKFVAAPITHAFAYQPAPAGCDNAAHGECTSYSLTATLETGGTYIKTSP